MPTLYERGSTQTLGIGKCRVSKQINWAVVIHNIAEAREELQGLEAALNSRKTRNEAELQLGLEHALHHLYFTWNARHVTSTAYAKLTDRDFNRWSKVPSDLEISHLGLGSDA